VTEAAPVEPSLEFEVLRWPLPPSDQGYGSRMVRLPGTATVLSTSPNGKLYTCDAITGRLRTGKRVAGELRSVVFDDEVGGADGAWALATFGLCRISLDSLARTGENVRKGIGKYQGRMVALSEDMLAVSAFYGRSMTLISRLDATVVKRLRMGAPEVVYTLPDGLHRCWSAHHAVATDIDLRTARCVARHRLPYGKGPAVLGDQVVVLRGERKDDAHAPDVWDIRPTHLVAYDRHTLTELWRTTAPGHGIEVLGQVLDGRITVACHSTVTVVNPSTGGVDGVYRHPGGIGGALLMPEHNTVLLKNRAADPQALTVLRWRPDPKVATVTDTGG
jgi:hypothetical protein